MWRDNQESSDVRNSETGKEKHKLSGENNVGYSGYSTSEEMSDMEEAFNTPFLFIRKDPNTGQVIEQIEVTIDELESLGINEWDIPDNVIDIVKKAREQRNTYKRGEKEPEDLEL